MVTEWTYSVTTHAESVALWRVSALHVTRISVIFGLYKALLEPQHFIPFLRGLNILKGVSDAKMPLFPWGLYVCFWVLMALWTECIYTMSRSFFFQDNGKVWLAPCTFVPNSDRNPDTINNQAGGKADTLVQMMLITQQIRSSNTYSTHLKVSVLKIEIDGEVTAILCLQLQDVEAQDAHRLFCKVAR